MTTSHSAGDTARHLCRLAFDLNSAALALAAEAADLACRGFPTLPHAVQLGDMGRMLGVLAAELESATAMMRQARVTAAWSMPAHAPTAIPAE